MSSNINDPNRRQKARAIRIQAAELAFKRPQVTHASNGDEFSLQKYKANVPTYISTFTKGLPHDDKTGLVHQQTDVEILRRAIFSGRPEDIRVLPLGPRNRGGNGSNLFDSAMANNKPAGLRAWESMGAGHTYDLEGPDAQAVTMPRAPAFKSDELALEMTEVYWMALLRDTPFSSFNEDNPLLSAAIRSMNKLPWVSNPSSTTSDSVALDRARRSFTPQTVFRGVLPGDDVGPYLSQFLFIGNEGLERGNMITDGYIQYGCIRIDQRVRTPTHSRDYMTSWQAWFDVQDGADVRGRESYVPANELQAFRFITTPRDLTCYVHYDALYEAYLNACLIMLSMGVPFDEGLPFGQPDAIDKQTGFATFGGPHILSLVTEVATRALKAVRFQKFNVHRRARPEVMAARIDSYRRGDAGVRQQLQDASTLSNKVDDEVLRRVFEHNKRQNASQIDNDTARSGDRDPYNSSGCSDDGTYLLPMPFAEGSPMHPAYGAGHATVAGACTTVLKAFFNTSGTFDDVYQPSADGKSVQKVRNAPVKLTIGGELNKVCSNISIGRNFAGVHYYSDYIESIRMGEEIAIGILDEQKLTFGEQIHMTLEKFDGSTIRI